MQTHNAFVMACMTYADFNLNQSRKSTNKIIIQKMKVNFALKKPSV